MSMYILEVCVDSLESALAAERGGADRVELCADLIVGGTTPSVGLFRQIRQLTQIAVHVLIRPRFGDFLYSSYEYDAMCYDAGAFLDAGADAIVSGFLTSDGALHQQRMEEMTEVVHAAGRSFTLHRAFDMVQNAFAAQNLCEAIGVDAILTAGQQNDCMKGFECICELDRRSQNTAIMAGAGLNTQNLPRFLQETAVRCFHMSAKKILHSSMCFRRAEVNMGLKGLSEYEIFRTDENEVRRARELLAFAAGTST